jgi:hypothetical protein
MDENFNSDLMDLQVKLQKELVKALPPALGEALDDLMFITLFRYLTPPTESGKDEARRILEKYKKMGF